MAQGYIADEGTGLRGASAPRQKVAELPAPNRNSGIPENENLIRTPVRLVPTLRKVLNATERLG